MLAKKLLLAVVGIWCCLSINPANATYQKKGSDKVSVELFTNFDKINLEQNWEALLKFSLHDGWHIYSQDENNIGLPTTIKWQMPLSFELINDKWSNDEEFVIDDIVQRGYGKTAYYKATIKPSADVYKTAKLEIEAAWLACNEECQPESAKFYLDLPMTEHNLRPSQTWLHELQKAEHHFSKLNHKNVINIQIAVLMAFIGGIILNFMPCVFPVLAIKAISLAQNRKSKVQNYHDVWLYTLGVLVSFIVIATILVILRAGGEEIGWGFQLQSPWFVGIMIVVFGIIFLLLIDLINVPSFIINKIGRISFAKQSWNSFFTGFFAVLIASPCTAPFMGMAIGYTLTAPLYFYYPVFVSLGIGYALPFALINMWPQKLQRILPRPGVWMERLKKVFAIPVLMTILWLGWVFYSQVAVDVRSRFEGLHWQEYNSLEVAEAVKNGQPVFIDFTAKWCITCLANHKLALQTQDFARMAKDKQMVLFQADWTNKDDTIAAALEKYGRNSIPLYVYYPSHADKYIILPQLLTVGILKDYIN